MTNSMPHDPFETGSADEQFAIRDGLTVEGVALRREQLKGAETDEIWGICVSGFGAAEGKFDDDFSIEVAKAAYGLAGSQVQSMEHYVELLRGIASLPVDMARKTEISQLVWYSARNTAMHVKYHEFDWTQESTLQGQSNEFENIRFAALRSWIDFVLEDSSDGVDKLKMLLASQQADFYDALAWAVDHDEAIDAEWFENLLSLKD